MQQSRFFPVLVALVALVVVAVVAAAGWRIVRGDGSLLRNVSVQHERITPNADGSDDITLVSYELAGNATASIYFEDAAGDRYYFRRDEPRGAGEYQVYFSGVVDGYRLPDENVQGEIRARLLRDGDYTWIVEATGEDGRSERATGSLAVADADPILPEIRDFSLSRHTFTPNQDGIEDRVYASFFLPKEVERTRLFLVMPDGTEEPLPELPQEARPNDPGTHTYEYEGGVDRGAQPPPDGTYPLVAVAEDAEGQKVRVEDEITIDLGGVPYATIISPVSGDTVRYESTAVQICDTLTFSVTVENYGETPIRTVGPWSGAVYDSDWNYNTMGWPTESGAWRLGIGYENALSDYPYRWGLGTPDTLEEIDGHHYLMPGERAVVTGSIRIVDVLGVRNPQPVWAGLIHEDVRITLQNNRVDTHNIRLDIPDPEHTPQCEEREPPTTRR